MGEVTQTGRTTWSEWRPNMRATLLFVSRRDEVSSRDEVLLIHKKTGLGSGKINAPGGKLEPGETAAEAAVREVREEVGLAVRDPQQAGVLRFQFTDGLALHCTVFRATEFDGEPFATREADPFWCAVDAIPFERMWADDALWLPGMLEGKTFDGRFEFDGETMLWHELAWEGATGGRND